MLRLQEGGAGGCGARGQRLQDAAIESSTYVGFAHAARNRARREPLRASPNPVGSRRKLLPFPPEGLEFSLGSLRFGPGGLGFHSSGLGFDSKGLELGLRSLGFDSRGFEFGRKSLGFDSRGLELGLEGLGFNLFGLEFDPHALGRNFGGLGGNFMGSGRNPERFLQLPEVLLALTGGERTGPGEVRKQSPGVGGAPREVPDPPGDLLQLPLSKKSG